MADNGLQDLLRREADIAIRHARPEQPNLIARRLRDETLRFYASHAYVEANGKPEAGGLGHALING